MTTNQLNGLIRNMKRREREYSDFAFKIRALDKLSLDAARYEGIATGTRWAHEDLAKRLKKSS